MNTDLDDDCGLDDSYDAIHHIAHRMGYPTIHVTVRGRELTYSPWLSRLRRFGEEPVPRWMRTVGYLKARWARGR